MLGTKIEPAVVVYIIGPSDLDRLRGGKGIMSPDRSFVLRYSPDLGFTENQLQDALAAGLAMDTTVFERIMEESKKRKTVTR